MKDLGGNPAAGAAPHGEPPAVAHHTVDENHVGQRIDNFLLRLAKGVPKSHVYRVIRAGEVRVNKKRVDADYRLKLGDLVRIPPMRIAAPNPVKARPVEFLVVFEDADLVVIDKPSGVAVHGGSGVDFGVIEQLRAARPEARFLELVHRLDRETSGLLMIAKKRSALTSLHEQMRGTGIDKRYLALCLGQLANQRQHVKAPLERFLLADGERRVRVNAEGMLAHTIFAVQMRLARFTLVEAQLKTGRTHQIRVHLAHLGHVIAGDDKYGDFVANRELSKMSPPLKRMFLHAASLEIEHPRSGERLALKSALPVELERFLAAQTPHA
jgi:23S rRNA pseudouridine955/2504/2580 synthase